MKILIPVIGFGRAGGYRVLSELANSWLDAGHEVVFLADRRSQKPYFPTRAEIVWFDFAGAMASSKDASLTFDSYGNAFSAYLGMCRALRKLSDTFDVVIANHSLTVFPVAFSRLRAKKIYYVQAYEPEYYMLESGLKASVLRVLSWLSYKMPLRQVANAPIYLQYKGITARDWVPPGVASDVFIRRTAQPTLSEEKIVIGVIGRQEPSKGTRYVLDAFEQLAATDPRYVLRVAFGNLPNGWSHPRAEVCTPLNDVELAEYYRSVDILIAPGTVQLGACHYPVLEAMASGTPVITTGYLPADKTNAWIVPVHSSEGITRAVKDIVASEPGVIRTKLDNAYIAVSGFYWHAVADRFLTLLR